ncbi:MAG: phosphatase PAP2/dual specificity phosphatase family protein [Acidobacteria bacterium]|nr:phosphatase PAP2/dual specificity phosphatase family protein [Acidobacteriota bacterium]
MIDWPVRLRALAWLVFLGSFFFLSYDFANSVAAARGGVPVLAFEWERNVPFLAWTILPYWSSDVLYALSFVLVTSRSEVDTHGLRLLAVQVVSVALFLLFPLQCGFAKPETAGWTGALFAGLASFDKPFNQAPSLHVSLAVILWDCYRRYLNGWARRAVGAWLVLVAVSTMTTYQHQFIDLPTGAWLGWLVVLTLPAKSPRYWPHAAAYGLVSVLFLWGAFSFAWILLWPAFSFSIVAAAYAGAGPFALRKRNGRMPWWMWPYEVAARANAWAWTRGKQAWSEIDDGIWVGRTPNSSERGRFATIVDLTAEMPVREAISIPVLDLTPVPTGALREGVEAASSARRPVLICCALGYARSAAVASAWWISKGMEVESAIEKVHRSRPGAKTFPATRSCLQQYSSGRLPTGV